MSRSSARRASQAAQARLEARRRQERRRRAVFAGAIAVAVLVVALLAGMGIWYVASQSDGSDSVPANVTADGHGVPVGDGPVTVEIYLDFFCPACKQFDQAARPALDRYLADGTITVVYRPIAILNRYSDSRYSTRAAAAAGCAADVEKMDEYVAVMMAAQPAGGADGPSNGEIVEITSAVGFTDAGFAQCVRDQTYRGWAEDNTNAAARRGFQSTPTVLVDGQQLPELSVADLTAAIDEAAA